MSIQLTMNMPEGAFSSMRKNPEEFADELRLAAAVKWYEIGAISQSKAAEIAGLSRQEFIFSLAKFKISPFQSTPEEIRKELKDAC